MIGLGCMRLSTQGDRDAGRGRAVIHAALDAGVTFLDTADVYCLGEEDIGHNERLIAASLAAWTGDPATITVATKGGMRRPKGAWVPDGRAKHLREACEASRRALGVETIALYQLHAVDPKTPLETSVRALAKLRDDGLIRDIGLCNVTVGQIESARAIAPIATVQVSLSPFDAENLRNGVAEYCRDTGIGLIAYRPLGGERARRLAKDPLLASIAARHGFTAQEVALAWLASFACHPERSEGETLSLAEFTLRSGATNGLGMTTVPGATRIETAASIGHAASLQLDDADLAALDERFSGRLLRIPRAKRRPVAPRGDVVLVMGMPGAGKSTLATSFESRGYERLNRDALGGSLSDLVPRLDTLLGGGAHRVVLDNTYPTRASRNEVIEAAWRRGAVVRCVWLQTTVADAQVNSIRRMIEAHGSLPTPEEIMRSSKSDPRYLLPDAQFRYERMLEPPTAAEGLESVETVHFERAVRPGISRALILDFDDIAAGDVHRRETLARHRADGWLVFAHAWRPGGGPLPALPEELAFVEVATCPHPAGPPVCWCRKPIPGSVLEFSVRRGVDLTRSIIVGAVAADRTLADRIGARFETVESFFG